MNGKYVSYVVAGTDFAGKQDGSPTLACFNSPSGIALDEKTNTIYVTESENHNVRQFTLHYRYQQVAPRYIFYLRKILRKRLKRDCVPENSDFTQRVINAESKNLHSTRENISFSRFTFSGYLPSI